ncbi:MAG: class I SAM-dependent methyltransferase [Rhodospirillaceae bacterium]|nr:class I SAM-dependent methyltransferase [Rhodospirillaceae bacterium]
MSDALSSSDNDNHANQVSAFWGNEHRDARKHNWLEHPTALECINTRRAGDATLDLADYWRRDFLRTPAKLGLSLGCGFGLWERIALQQNLCERMEAYDVSEAAVAQARIYAAEAGLSDRVTYGVIDMERAALEPARYDAIFGISSLHHVQNLDRLFAACRAALKPGGLMFIDEYVGPARFQSAPHVVALINQLIQLLPSAYRRSVYLNGALRETYSNIPLEWFAANDPSEAITSDQIVPALQKHFAIIDNKPYGGALLHMLLSGTAGNFDPHKPEDAALIRMLAFFEQELEQAGTITTDFASFVAKPLP